MKALHISYYLFILFLASSCSVIYKFEINQDEYRHYIPKSSPISSTTKSKMLYHNNYYGDVNSINSIPFPNIDSKTWINIEHLVKVVNNDLINLPKIKDTHHLFTAVEFHKDLIITEVKIEHFYNNKPLNQVASYIYEHKHYKDSASQFIINETKYNLINTRGSFSYVNIYTLPKSKFSTLLLPRYLWFNSSMKEKITIKYKNNGEILERVFEFDLTWTRREYWVT